MDTLYYRLIRAGLKKEALGDWNCCDLQVPVTRKTSKIIREYLNEKYGKGTVVKETAKAIICSNHSDIDKFASNIPGEGMFYYIPFGYTPYWENAVEEALMS